MNFALTNLARALMSGAFAFFIMLLGSFPAVSLAEESSEDIARKLNNPISELISVPLQLNFDRKIGPEQEGERLLLNFQPVVPVSISDDWNLVVRTIAPLVRLNDFPPGVDEKSGLGDVLQSLFFSPKEPTSGGWIWGVGPVLLFPTASDQLLGTGKWGAGPTAVVLKQQNGWTYGALANHVWSYAGADSRDDVNATFAQPFLAHTLPTFTTFTLNTETTYNWEAEDWAVPVLAAVTQVFKISGQPMSVQLGTRYWADSPDGAAEGWGFRVAYTLVLPK